MTRWCEKVSFFMLFLQIFRDTMLPPITVGDVCICRLPFFTTAGLLVLSFLAVGSATDQRQTAPSVRGFLINNNGHHLISCVYSPFFTFSFEAAASGSVKLCVIWAFKRSHTVFVCSHSFKSESFLTTLRCFTTEGKKKKNIKLATI